MRRLLLILALVLLPTQALAECAWVMWTTSTIPLARGDAYEIGWEPFLAYTKLDECQQEAASRLNKFLEREGAELLGDTALTKGGELYTFRCLPDTIDPRGKKD